MSSPPQTVCTCCWFRCYMSGMNYCSCNNSQNNPPWPQPYTDLLSCCWSSTMPFPNHLPRLCLNMSHYSWSDLSRMSSCHPDTPHIRVDLLCCCTNRLRTWLTMSHRLDNMTLMDKSYTMSQMCRHSIHLRTSKCWPILCCPMRLCWSGYALQYRWHSSPVSG